MARTRAGPPSTARRTSASLARYTSVGMGDTSSQSSSGNFSRASCTGSGYAFCDSSTGKARRTMAAKCSDSVPRPAKATTPSHLGRCLQVRNCLGKSTTTVSTTQAWLAHGSRDDDSDTF
eukprot:3506464-Alexandrium_andersonii.AAC.1